MNIKYQNLRYRGQPVFREWNQNKTELRIYSWKTRKCAGGGWKVTERPVLARVIFRKNAALATKLAKIKEAEERLVALPGVVQKKGL